MESTLPFTSNQPVAADFVDEDERIDHETKKQQLSLLKKHTTKDGLHGISTAPLFTYPILQYFRRQSPSTSPSPISQYGFLAGEIQSLQEGSSADPRIFYNVAAPSSVFICGSQGSGKSHTLSCILENCLVQSEKLGCLPRPLTGIVFHYDDYASDTHVSPCEAAYLASNPAVSVRVLCSRTNIRAIRESYEALGAVTVETLCIDQTDLNTGRMLELMAFDRTQPLYAHVVQRILRDMRLVQQDSPSKFKYRQFIEKLNEEKLSPDQKRGLQQRLDTLESFMVHEQIDPFQRRYSKVRRGTDWEPKASELLIVDLSCPCITASMACALFNICLSIFLAQDSCLGKIVALDEAHKYMGDTSDSEALTKSLLTAVRFQRHIGTRIIISTQEPTVSPRLLDLCSITIVHRFTSPDWLNVLTQHLAGISRVARMARADRGEEADADSLRGIPVSQEDPMGDLFTQIVELDVGEALVFAPSAVLSLRRQEGSGQEAEVTMRKLGHNVLKVVVRARITADGGRSIMAS